MKIPKTEHIDQLISSLSDEIPHVETFKGKWAVIKGKLGDLKTQVADFSDFHGEFELSQGKLQTQSNIDLISATLDRLIKDGEILIRSGVLQDGIGSSESKNSTMDSLLGLLSEDDKNVIISVAQGVVPVFVRLLDSNSSVEMKENTVAFWNREVGSQEKRLVSFSKENTRAIGCRGGISSLLEICDAGTPNSQAIAVGVLRNPAGFQEIKENFIEENAISVILGP
ncbi:hypothetical protein CK203_057045 [Vitis vinifera]|uniref:DUF7032 domain-containing protein n=1 Tax=Vitis vinifera TaxID=29760 RepID=A0A438GN58_VITVI|nr:hypothetical protein CK203_057045 [Vitis vinifera]